MYRFCLRPGTNTKVHSTLCYNRIMGELAKTPEGRARIALQQQSHGRRQCRMGKNIKSESDEVVDSNAPDAHQSCVKAEPFVFHSSPARVSSSSGSLEDVQSHRHYWLERDYYRHAIKAEVITQATVETSAERHAHKL